MSVESVLEKIAVICEGFGISAILFGSHAKGTARERSDIDIAVECDDATFDMIKEKIDGIETLRKIDLVNLCNCSKESFLREVRTYGKVL